jgi:hypothetical protein
VDLNLSAIAALAGRSTITTPAALATRSPRARFHAARSHKASVSFRVEAIATVTTVRSLLPRLAVAALAADRADRQHI